VPLTKSAVLQKKKGSLKKKRTEAKERGTHPAKKKKKGGKWVREGCGEKWRVKIQAGKTTTKTDNRGIPGKKKDVPNWFSDPKLHRVRDLPKGRPNDSRKRLTNHTSERATRNR